MIYDSFVLFVKSFTQTMASIAGQTDNNDASVWQIYTAIMMFNPFSWLSAHLGLTWYLSSSSSALKASSYWTTVWTRGAVNWWTRRRRTRLSWGSCCSDGYSSWPSSSSSQTLSSSCSGRRPPKYPLCTLYITPSCPFWSVPFTGR